MSRHHPWLIGLLLAPLYFGSVTAEGQVFTAVLCCTSLVLLAGRLENPSSGLSWGWIALIGTALVLPIIPLPASLVGWLSPHRLALAKEFPVDGETVPALLTLTISPAATLARLWNLLLAATVFCLARAAAREPDGARTLTLYLAFTLALLASQEIWRRATGGSMLFPDKEIPVNRGAGTFADRNHFAGWIAAASLFGLGWVLRAWLPLQSARGFRPGTHLGGRGDSIFVLVCVTCGLAVAVYSGSRGGALALAVGLAVWMALLIYRSKRRSRLMLIFLILVGLLCPLLLVSGNLLDRLAATSTDLGRGYPKLALWQQSLAIFTRFPFFGTGWDTFRPAFSHFKNFAGDLTFFHAENEYIQFLVETGLLGVVAAAALLVHFGRRALTLALRDRCAEPEAAFGAIAGLAAFATLAGVDYVTQLPSTALLAAALAGFVIGNADPLSAVVLSPSATSTAVPFARDQTFEPDRLDPDRDAEIDPELDSELATAMVTATATTTATTTASAAGPPPPLGRRRLLFNVAWSLALGLPLLLQIVALWHLIGALYFSPTWEIQARHYRSSLSWWPCATHPHPDLLIAEKEVVLTLPSAERPAATAAVRDRLNRLLWLDPYNGNLRSERAEFDLDHTADTARAKREIRDACRLNPLNEMIPLHFARRTVTNDPSFALELIRNAPRTEINLPHYLALAWQANPSTADLWPLVPDTVGGLTALAEFGLEKKLPRLAANAWLRLTNHLTPSVLAEKLLVGQRPDLAFTLLPRLSTNRADRLLALRIYLADQKYKTAIEKAEALWLAGEASKTFRAPYPASLALETAHTDWLADQANPIAARRLAEKIFQQPLASRDLNLLRTLAGSFPRDLRLTWMHFSTLRDLEQYPEAATNAVNLAIQAAPFD